MQRKLRPRPRLHLRDLGVATQKICRAHSPFSFELNFIEQQGVLSGSDD
jgi:hypothetical protein